MARVAGRIIKSGDVEVKGKFKLELMQIGQGPPKDSNRPLVTPQVRVIEKQSEFAIIELTCSCGTKTSLRCEYADVQSSDETAGTQNTTADS